MQVKFRKISGLFLAKWHGGAEVGTQAASFGSKLAEVTEMSSPE